MARIHNRKLFFVGAVFFGLLLGNVVALALKDVFPIIFEGPDLKLIINELNLIVLSFSFSFNFKVSLGGLLGLLVGLYVYFSN
ncbi:MAG: hypothetical protein DDT22_00116 [candidate division WS2 bacterium]|uniref:DUF4321 domain-containing protein n=1 Tax=Candidatus Hakubella thermalkaliphila TaxID=2754717 RepID=A0A6V8P7G5_9ACTN|nr:hypothetical protein [Candidatus Lithacetigena glycinireducens]GFP28303.1 hypothetical protein HKBW3S33_01718 [Candidatus Hakubella thermalkaliphila]GFP43507.1 hypothetical protein HKBW3C_02637 [Candidatus Hakubella thermalkaliphila]